MAGAQNTKLSVAERRRQKEASRRRREDGHGSDEGAPAEALLAELAHNPRNHREELRNLEGLAATYASVGVVQSVAVVSAATYCGAFPEHADDVGTARWVVIGGNRRLAAARLAGIEKLPILVNKAQTRKDITIAAAVENLSQESLKPLEELNTIEDLKQELGTYDAVAAQLGKSPGWVSLRRRLHNLVPEVRQALADGDLTIEAARELGKIKDRSPQLDAWEAHKREEARRAAEPKPKRRRKSSPPSDERKSEGESNARSGKPTMPPQGGPAPAGDDVQARRVACTQAISAGADDNGVILIAALQAPVDAAQAQELASQWLNAANAETTPLELKHASSLDTGLQAQAALALALAHCELHTTSTGSTPQARAYTDWLAAHTSYQPATAPSTFTA